MSRLHGVAASLLLAAASPAMAASAVEDRFLIMELMDRYGIVHDFGAPEEFAALFTEDAVVESGARVLRGRENLIKQAQQDEERYWKFRNNDGTTSSFMRHVISNRQVKITGRNTAEGSCYVITIINDREAGPQVFSMSRYVDRYRKVRGEWRIEHRTIVGESGNPGMAGKYGFR